ncbi:class I SAM-dependent methyltransferase [Burkholderia alba]|uniref:class I SAM-dependent methyltransferase n=1 Tax=Burkholderia alba TaxID=2683677 RepID=UPI002B054C60|nr:class I SAM-dependent methyltransferase [Burkholderia alba]
MTQNIYDDPAFFDGYSRLNRSMHGLDGAPEWPALRAQLPDLRGADVVDLGCGYGWFCRWAAEHGAASVLGIDVSEKMLARAAATTPHTSVRYRRADLETLDLPDAAFDLVYSSLAFHYIEHLPALFATLHRALAPGGTLLFSIEHPIFMAPAQPGFVTGADGRRTWPIDRYQVEGPRVTHWLAEGVVKQHRTLATLVNLLIAQGFTLAHLDEWGPTQAQIDAMPALADERERPMMLLVRAQR